MKPEGWDFGGGPRASTMHPLVMVALVLTIILVITLPRKKALVPFLLTLFLVPMGQQIYFAGFHWLVFRLVILAACLRLAISKFQKHEEILRGGLNGMDKIFILWAFERGVAPMLLFRVSGMVVLQIALWIGAFGGYFFLRHLIQDEDDIARAAKTFAVLAVIFGLFMLHEKVRDVNIFGYLGGVPITPPRRDGQIRAQASFGHPILAGCFGASLIPLFFWLWNSRRSRTTAFFGMLGSTLMVLASASSTPVLAYVGGVGALLLWPIRNSMRVIRWGIVITLAVLAMVMKAPVWFIVAHMNVVGSGGYDRAALIDVFIRHFWDWWLIGTNQTGSWGYFMFDLSNQFAAEGENGGLIVFICFLAMITKSFSWLGKMRRQVQGDKKQEWFYWSLCAVMFAHILCFFGVSYWDQTQLGWFVFLAIISAATVALRNPSSEATKTNGAVLESVPVPEPWLWDRLHSSEVIGKAAEWQ